MSISAELHIGRVACATCLGGQVCIRVSTLVTTVLMLYSFSSCSTCSSPAAPPCVRGTVPDYETLVLALALMRQHSPVQTEFTGVPAQLHTPLITRAGLPVQTVGAACAASGTVAMYSSRLASSPSPSIRPLVPGAQPS